MTHEDKCKDTLVSKLRDKLAKRKSDIDIRMERHMFNVYTLQTEGVELCVRVSGRITNEIETKTSYCGSIKVNGYDRSLGLTPNEAGDFYKVLERKYLLNQRKVLDEACKCI